ncbi:hypothetical protein [Spongiivirga citrea]|uniref:TolC family protein n=1 Tax=Spongiivirga citrea TaxID=1481457 RepID=A0A6M0CHD8_9FLAO|nr:hypothetical protein [Spongiivirga citrea]NER17366.1 hypothetical protein [Spongiivirga citrea]
MKAPIFIVLLLISTIAKTQEIDSLLLQSYDIYKNADTLLHFPNSKDDIDINIFSIAAKSSPTLYEIKLKELESNSYKKDWGLQIKANSYYNFRGVLDEETNNITVSRFSAELEWNILKGGFVANRSRATATLLEKQLLDDALDQENRIIWRRQFRLHYNYSINQELLNHFERKNKFLERYFDILNTLYVKKMIKREEIINISNELLKSREQYNQIKFYQENISDSIPPFFLNKQLPLIKLQLSEIDISKSIENEIKTTLQKNIIQRENRAFKDIKFSLYANYNWTETMTRQFSSPVIGARFSAPIRFNNRKKIIQTKIQQAEAKQEDNLIGKQNQLVTYLSAHQEKIKDIHTLYKQWLILEQRKRIAQIVREELGVSNCGLLMLQYTKEQYDVIENVLQLKKQLYTVVSHIVELNQKQDVRHLISSISFNQDNTLNNVVITKNSFSQKLQFQFLKAKKIERVQMTFRDHSFEDLLKKEGVEISFTKPAPNAIFLEKLISDELKIIAKK